MGDPAGSTAAIQSTRSAVSRDGGGTGLIAGRSSQPAAPRCSSPIAITTVQRCGDVSSAASSFAADVGRETDGPSCAGPRTTPQSR